MNEARVGRQAFEIRRVSVLRCGMNEAGRQAERAGVEKDDFAHG
jgi:hypothetical protein